MSHPHNHAAILREVATLFYGHADLMMEFTYFLPLTEQTAVSISTCLWLAIVQRV
jgi:hypothetical protein